MCKRLLVAIDGSPGSDNALKYAIGLAKACSAALRLVHVVDAGWLAVGQELGLDIDRLADARRASGEQLLALAKKKACTEGIATEVGLAETGTPARDIASAIAEESVQWARGPRGAWNPRTSRARPPSPG